MPGGVAEAPRVAVRAVVVAVVLVVVVLVIVVVVLAVAVVEEELAGFSLSSSDTTTCTCEVKTAGTSVAKTSSLLPCALSAKVYFPDKPYKFGSMQ